MSLLDTLISQGAHVSNMTADSRLVGPGSLFVAYPGAKADGRQFIAQAIEQGAAAVLWDQQAYAWNPQWDLPNMPVKDLRAQAGYIADGFYGRPSHHLWMIGITGTNGKTSCSHWLAQTLEMTGRKSAVIGTLGNGFVNSPHGALSTAINTTPDPILLQGMLADYLANGAKAVAMEVSSHGLELGRVNGVHFDVALFTNFTRDHLDFHGDMASYAAAKRKLFDWDGLSCCVLNVDDEFGKKITQEINDQGRETLTYGFGAADVQASHLEFGRLEVGGLQLGRMGISMQVHTPYGDGRISAPVMGRFNAYNLLAVLSSLLVSGVSLADATLALSKLNPVAGRMQAYGGDKAPLVIVDYAHTPDALENVLNTLREQSNLKEQCHEAQSSPRLICVFGCGGERDAGKRPLMGSVAARLADQVIITDDNPRSEQSASIIADIVSGFVSGIVPQTTAQQAYNIEPDRATAIRQAIVNARAGDIVLVAGKGHEHYQEIAGVKYPFSDAQVVAQVLQELAA